MKYLSADWIFPITSEPIEKGVLVIENDGTIVDLVSAKSNKVPTEYFPGILVPGFVNAHCHLELSHLKGKIPQHTGLIDFLLTVQQIRDQEPEVQQRAMKAAEEEMLRNGIVAVGDISNSSASFSIKAEGKLYYHTFIELIGFNPERAQMIFDNGKSLASNCPNSSLTPHAPYSVSNRLMQLIDGEEGIISIHNQECAAEDPFFEFKKGDFNRLYESFHIPIEFFEPNGLGSLKNWLPNFRKSQKIQSVHNTYIQESDLEMIKDSRKEFYFCLCPGANGYIENHQPPLERILLYSDRITVGTDSLASNTGLNILEELHLLQEAHPTLSLKECLPWATINGARFLGIEKNYGSLEKGKKPGILQIQQLSPTFRISTATTLTRII